MGEYLSVIIGIVTNESRLQVAASVINKGEKVVWLGPYALFYKMECSDGSLSSWRECLYHQKLGVLDLAQKSCVFLHADR